MNTKTIKPYFYPIFRIIIGLLFFAHGASKFGIIGQGSLSGFAGAFSLPIWLAFIAAFIELIGGVAIAIGLFTRPAAFASAIVMLSALGIAHLPKGWNPMVNGGELALVFFGAFLILMVFGSQNFSIEKSLIKKEIF